MWARPDTGGAPTSYPAPTWSAAKGILESIAYLACGSAYFHPTAVEICRRRGEAGGDVRFQQYATNYNGPLRKDQNVQGGTPMQFFATVLSDVCYRIHADVRGDRMQTGRHPRRHLHDLFERRLKRGQCFRTPALGWREFACDYWGAIRDEWETDCALNVTIPSMLDRVWDRPQQGSYASRFQQDVQVKRGVLKYAE